MAVVSFLVAAFLLQNTIQRIAGLGGTIKHLEKRLKVTCFVLTCHRADSSLYMHLSERQSAKYSNRVDAFL
jgi:hypothetical protein